MVVRVRRAVLEDAASIAAIHVRSWQVAYRGLMPDGLLDGLSVEQREESWQEALGESAYAMYVAVDDAAVLGFCAVATPSRDDDAQEGVAEIGAIYVEPSMWRTGAGRALMDVALADLRADGWRQVTLWVLAENQPARDFYSRFGLMPDGAEMTHAGSGATEVRLRGPIAT